MRYSNICTLLALLPFIAMPTWAGQEEESAEAEVPRREYRTGRVEGEYDRRVTYVFQLAFVWNPVPHIW